MKVNGQELTVATLVCVLMAALTSCNSTPHPESKTQTRQASPSTPTLTADKVPGPAPGNIMTKEYVQMVGGLLVGMAVGQ
jgi:hypothetical protein